MASAWETAKQVVRIVSPLTGRIIESVEKATGAVNLASDKGIDALREEVAKQELRLQFDLQQAKIAQELAIAQRILNAEVVEIEEFYDRSGRGHLGAKGDQDGATLGFGAEGKSVVKRIYKFIARRSETEDNSNSGAGNECLPKT